MHTHLSFLSTLKIVSVSTLLLCAYNCDAANLERKFDAGISTNDIVYECVLGGVEKKTVQAVLASCGCTVVDIQKGQVLDESKPFKVRIALDGKPPGVGSQTIRIMFEDKTETVISIGYDYRPLPSCIPRYILFGKSDTNIAVTFFFPGEEEAKIMKTTCPNFIKCTIETKDRSHPDQIVATFSCNRQEMCNASENKGVIWIETDSKRMPKLGIPFLWLDH